MTESVNPYQPPDADIEPPAPSGQAGQLLDPPRAWSAGQGTAWIGQGWVIFRDGMGTWIGMFLVSGLAFAAISMIPLVGLLAGFLMPIFIGGWMIGCERMRTENEVRFEDLFAGFSDYFAPLAIASLIYNAVNFLAVLLGGVVAVAFGGSMMMFMGSEPGSAGFGLGFALGFLIILALTLPVIMLIWFAPALITLHQVAPIDALKMSFQGCLRNILPFLVFSLVATALFIVGMLPLLLGLLLVIPWLTCANYSAYRDIYVSDAD